MILTEIYSTTPLVDTIVDQLTSQNAHLTIDGTTGSLPAVVIAATATRRPSASHLVVAPSQEEAYYLQNDLEALLPTDDSPAPRVLLFPGTLDVKQSANLSLFTTQRTEVLRELSAGHAIIVVSYAEALDEPVPAPATLSGATLRLSVGEDHDMWEVVERLQEAGFEREDFVVEPGQMAVRGGIVDVFSFGAESPYRIEFDGDRVESIRLYDAATQLSIRQLDRADITGHLESTPASDTPASDTDQPTATLEAYFAGSDALWQIGNSGFSLKLMRSTDEAPSPTTLALASEPQPTFNKQFDMLNATLADYADHGYRIFITAAGESQQHRLQKILASQPTILNTQLSHGFVDHDQQVVCFTDHEIFGRYHKYRVRDLARGREAMTLKELFELKPGDFVTHIDYGVGRFSGLEKVTTNGKSQELIRLIYKNNDVLYISIHGLHKISRYVGREGETPQLNRLGSNTWQVLKQRTKRQVKDIARDLIALYAKRKASHGFAFSPDGELQAELEASFQYDDTPDQLKATVAVKSDMEDWAPMDRLVCGDVGFGKTEVAIRAAMKACCDSKQVAVLVPSTVLAFQHYNTFSERLKGMPVRVDYLNRFRTAKERKQIYADVAAGRIDILIGTHAITNKELQFKDLGLLIVDEEQKFGVSVKEKLKQMKVGVDCLTLTATPIPRTLQFSLMGARDLSIIQTPPPNRQPIETEVCDFSEELIREAVMYEMSRSGQTFFISNRVENLPEMAGMVQRLVPDARVAMAHGRMDGKDAEETLMRFLEGDIDVLVATSIVENGLDIPNANTMIINNAHQFGLSDLHQMRGRVGRSNRKAFCYMMVPTQLTLTPDAQRRLRAIEEFSSIGSGFNIAMRDLDIRGAGNILGAEQSGFISEVGYDMYHKILNEALEELHLEMAQTAVEQPTTDQPQPLAHFPLPDAAFVKECTIETDLEVLLPDDYVTSVSERLLLYKELNDIDQAELPAYRQRLQDRFGPVPPCVDELISTITLRQHGKAFGIEKMILKQNRMICHFPSSQQNPFYRSPNFGRLIAYVQAHPRRAALKETADRLSVSIGNIPTIAAALEQMRLIEG